MTRRLLFYRITVDPFRMVGCTKIQTGVTDWSLASVPSELGWLLAAGYDLLAEDNYG